MYDTEDSKRDEKYEQAVGLLVLTGKASTSFLQRKLGLGYNAAARLMERAEEEGLVSRPNHVGKRDVLASIKEYAPAPDWTEAARHMLETWDHWFSGAPGGRAKKVDADRLARAGCFAAQAYCDAMTSIGADGAPGVLMRATRPENQNARPQSSHLCPLFVRAPGRTIH